MYNKESQSLWVSFIGIQAHVARNGFIRLFDRPKSQSLAGPTEGSRVAEGSRYVKNLL